MNAFLILDIIYYHFYLIKKLQNQILSLFQVQNIHQQFLSNQQEMIYFASLPIQVHQSSIHRLLKPFLNYYKEILHHHNYFFHKNKANLPYLFSLRQEIFYRWVEQIYYFHQLIQFHSYNKHQTIHLKVIFVYHNILIFLLSLNFLHLLFHHLVIIL